MRRGAKSRTEAADGGSRYDRGTRAQYIQGWPMLNFDKETNNIAVITTLKYSVINYVKFYFILVFKIELVILFYVFYAMLLLLIFTVTETKVS